MMQLAAIPTMAVVVSLLLSLMTLILIPFLLLILSASLSALPGLAMVMLVFPSLQVKLGLTSLLSPTTLQWSLWLTMLLPPVMAILALLWKRSNRRLLKIRAMQSRALSLHPNSPWNNPPP